MIEIPPFTPFSDALMASLASRSHEWVGWQIEESLAPDESLLSCCLEVCTRTVSGTFALAQVVLKGHESPSLSVQKLLESASSTEAPCFKLDPTLAWPSWSSEDKIHKNQTDKGNIRAKNSKGFFERSTPSHNAKKP